MATASGGSAGARPCQFDRLSESLSEGNLDDMERRVSTAFQVIDKLCVTLASLGEVAGEPETDEARWIKNLADLKAQSKPTQVIIGVVGNTGAGKSSVINAILEEERIVPTSCFRACTAVITELSYNHSSLPDELYRGEIEFIKEEDWLLELTHVKDDLIDSKGHISKEAGKADTDAGVSWAKVKAVYPELTQDEFARASVDSLVNDARIYGVLGNIKTVSAATVEAFYPKLQEYIDSTQGKSSKKGRRKKGEPKREKKAEFWPLVRVVRIYTKARALSTGARVVDLPGVQDSNAARAAVAEKYIQNCSSLWIVAPISRAVSDKTAQHLLGERFKLQMRYDNSYSCITFIASKADDISISEAIEDLDLAEDSGETTSLLDRFEEVSEETSQKKHELEGLEAEFSSAKASLTDAETKLDMWQKLAVKQNDGQAVFSPQATPQKRRLHDSPHRPMTKRAAKEYDYTFGGRSSSRFKTYFEDSDESASMDLEDSDGSVSETEDEREPLSREVVQSNLENCKNSHVEALQHFQECESRLTLVREGYGLLEDELLAIKPIVKAMCIRARNAQSRSAIRDDFARGIKELDHDYMNDEDFDPEDEIRNYDQVAESLPVFCVSSIAYQTLSGRFRQDGKTPGFQSLEETEVPQLQDHAIALTESARAETAKRFLGLAFQQLNSLSIWAISNTTQHQLGAAEKVAEKAHLGKVLGQLRHDLVKLINETVDDCREKLKKKLFSVFDVACSKAEAKAVSIAEGWSKKSTEGGLHFQTYQATCRRQGEFSGRHGHRNLNQELLHPLQVSLANAWDRVFTKHIPKTIEWFSRDSRDILDSFHSNYCVRMELKLNESDMHLLHSQIRIRQEAFKDAVVIFKATVDTLQKEANREFIPVIKRTLTQAYLDCRQVSGPGSFMRMKEHMIRHITEEKRTMFQESCENVEECLLRLCDESRKVMCSKIKETVDAMATDCTQAIMGREVSPTSKIVRFQIQQLLSRVASSFESGQLDPLFDELAPTEQGEEVTVTKKEEQGPRIKQEEEVTSIKQEDA
ncbi:hypothetical protein E8E14_009036 [Neopestalotiopsis sp. 37M]|nr:hypothetical protein E8E14_009036 [Neopestalotiopsis sp. 37M]